VRYQMIQRCRDSYPVRLMCRCLKVSTSGFYAWLGRKPSQRTLDNERLLKRMHEIHTGSDGVLGRPRMHEQLVDEGESCSYGRVERLMIQAKLYGLPQRKKWRRKPSTTRPAHVRNHLERDFCALEPNTKWVTDITYIQTGERWLYLCVVVDLYAKEVIGWSMSSVQDTQLVINAVHMALWKRDRFDEPVILHSDRGSQYTSQKYQQFLEQKNLICSMSAVGHCGDNAAAEGFFGMLKRERVYRRNYRTHAEARLDIFDYIERFYNRIVRRRIARQDELFLALT